MLEIENKKWSVFKTGTRNDYTFLLETIRYFCMGFVRMNTLLKIHFRSCTWTKIMPNYSIYSIFYVQTATVIPSAVIHPGSTCFQTQFLLFKQNKNELSVWNLDLQKWGGRCVVVHVLSCRYNRCGDLSMWANFIVFSGTASIHQTVFKTFS